MTRSVPNPRDLISGGGKNQVKKKKKKKKKKREEVRGTEREILYVSVCAFSNLSVVILYVCVCVCVCVF